MGSQLVCGFFGMLFAVAVSENIECHRISIPSLKAKFSEFRVARTCWPSSQESFPLHVFAHGDFGGGGASFSYYGLQEQIASFGFVVAMYESCWQDGECFNGQESFREVIKTLQHFEGNPTVAPVNFTLPYSVSGHSTGARVALMLASIRDSLLYLSATPFNVSASERTTVNRIQAVIADHPDAMSDSRLNPDLVHYSITNTPVFILTGTRDHIEPELSGWQDFTAINHSRKIFADVINATHLAPIETHPEGEFIARFALYFAVGDSSQEKWLYSNSQGALFNESTLPLAQAGDYNTGDGKVGAVACQMKAGSVQSFPTQFVQYCSP